ncbi:type II secretion system F family protein [Microbacterium sp. ET2]|uniref:type II secretion system F family protein n=1 Tax=Microbacterium albipurpureum TaxID=3050384 RepID=UPI00259D1BBE|nr:type II secretion system F family protein [Microbacterium sp. ET2 (Ac-2212)]WJL95890.1 type II secretion system F family protein [Microbacterium sp. ET2 (Ac-2212)]
MTTLALTDASLAVVLGVALGAGVLLLLSRAPRWRSASLSQRIAPYIRDITDPIGATPLTAGFGDDLAAIRQRVLETLAARLAGSVSVERRLRQAGSTSDVASFRGRQLGFALAGLTVGAVVVVVLMLTGRGSPAVGLLPPLFATAGAAACDLQLSRAARHRRARTEEELPTVLEFLALCLSAGEGILDALRRVGDLPGGDLTIELRGAVVAVGTGSSLSDALADMAARVDSPAVSRAVDHLVAAIDRGAPLAQVLHAQALDAREDAKRSLIERAGRNEIAMLVPRNPQ